MKRLIVNSDDYGHSRGVSQGIRQAHLNGIVTSTTTMLNYPGAGEDLRAAMAECPRLGLGLHLVLTSGSPVLPVAKVPSLVDSDGQFHRLEPFIAQIEKIDPAEVSLEWHAQVDAFKAATGRAPDHLDSHHHISFYTPALFEEMLKLAGELGCPIRMPFGMEGTVLNGVNEPKAASRDITSQYGYAQIFLDGFYDTGVTLANLETLLNQVANDPQHETFELMTHPAVVDEDLRRTSSYNDKRAEELILLQAEEVKQLLKQNNIQLIRFSDL
jgi:chitin disaccharide deacetylase